MSSHFVAETDWISPNSELPYSDSFCVGASDACLYSVLAFSSPPYIEWFWFVFLVLRDKMRLPLLVAIDSFRIAFLWEWVSVILWMVFKKWWVLLLCSKKESEKQPVKFIDKDCTGLELRSLNKPQPFKPNHNIPLLFPQCLPATSPATFPLHFYHG